MKSSFFGLLGGLGCLAVCGAAHGRNIMIEGVDSPFMLNAGSVPTLFGGLADHDFSDAMITVMHDELHAAGIVTDGFVTLLFAETGDALAFFALVDDVTGDIEQGNTELAMISTAPSSSEYWVNDVGGDVDNVFTSDGMITLEASFKWNNGKGDGMAWSGLMDGDDVSFSFSPIGSGTALSGPEPYQFVSATEDGWEVVETGGYVDDTFDFNFSVPLPAPGALALFGVLGLAGSSRRRRV